jgi:hypothetical protein
MTEEEITRFALQLREAERIRAMIAQEEDASSNGGGEGIPIAAAPAEEEIPIPAIGTAA